MSIQVQNISNTKLFSLTKISYLYLFIIHSTNTINMNTEKIIREISLTKNLSKNRQKSYNHIIKHYENSNNKTLPELLEEAEIEEEQGIPLRKRNLKQRLLQYKQYLHSQKIQCNKNIPELRFPEFEGEWITYKLCDVVTRIIRKNKNFIVLLVIHLILQTLILAINYLVI